MKFTWLKIGALTAAAAAATVCGVILKRRSVDRDRVISEGIRKNASVFDGLYEGLFQAARNREMFSTDAYEEWCDRAAQLEDEAFSAAFASAFSKRDIADELRCRGKFDRLLAYIAQASILRERENGTVYVADETMHAAYRTIDGSELTIGSEYSVLTSAWISGKKVIEYGMVMKNAVG